MTNEIAAYDPSESELVEFFGDKQIRWYQHAIKGGVLNALSRGVRRVLIGSPTGTGKTLTTAVILNSPELHKVLGIPDRKLRVVFLAHLHRLLTQAERIFADSMNVEVRMATPFKQVADSDIDWCDLIVIDECHHEAMMSIQYQLDRITTVPILGLTATPDRSDGLLIKFEEIISPISRDQAVTEGWLAETSIWSIVDLSPRYKVPIVKSILDQYAHTMGPTIVFMRTRAEVREVADHITKLGYRCEALLTQSNEDLDIILDEMTEGKVDFVVNCAKIGEGVDVPCCSSIILGRQLGSYTLLNQIVGRAARPDSECNVYELINPLSTNLDTTVVVGTPKRHLLCSQEVDGSFSEQEFDYTGHHSELSSDNETSTHSWAVEQ